MKPRFASGGRTAIGPAAGVRVGRTPNSRKPEPEAYLRCLARVGAAAVATLFVDDSVKNAAGAERAGLRAHLYRSPEGLEGVLSAEGLL
jgi:glucose-1-phosphatase